MKHPLISPAFLILTPFAHLRDCVCVWLCVMHREHANRRDTSLGAAFSPCMRYVACGSEDKGRAVLYDLRTSRAVSPPVGSSSSSSFSSASSGGGQRLQVTPHTDCVPCVAFNPLWPQLASASYDGSIRFFTSEV